ncbi:MAG: nitroreductase family protein [Coriobacteriia bacterium]|nr:nitroreductase family protein [Coriobacteriia bacterium]
MPDMLRLMQNRHDVRNYSDEPIAPDVAARLQEEIDAVNGIAGLHVQLIQDDPKGISGFMAAYEQFRNVKNYLVMVGPNTMRLDEQCGYFGEHLVLIAQHLGLNTCWAGLGFNRKRGSFQKDKGERAAIAIAIGHGRNQGASKEAKSASDISNLNADSPEWFRRGIQAVLLAPTVLDEQAVRIDLLDDSNPDGRRHVRIIAAEKGHFNYVDFGIAKYHFETVAGTENFVWV